MARTEIDADACAKQFRRTLAYLGYRASKLSLESIRNGCQQIGPDLVIEEVAQPGESGRTFLDGDTWRIWHDPTEKPSRRRFTLLHEFGHYQLRRSGHRVADEERWCDRFAAEVLAPCEQVRQIVHPGDSVVENVERVSECFGVSFSTSLKRINETTGSSWRVILYWRRQGRWVIHSTVDIPKGTASTFRTVAATRDVLEHLPSYRTSQISLPIGAFGRDIRLPATALRHDDYCQFFINWLDLARAIRATLEPPGRRPL